MEIFTLSEVLYKSLTVKHLVKPLFRVHVHSSRVVLYLQSWSKVSAARTLHSSAYFRKNIFSDPANQGTRQDGVNFDQVGSWENRLDLPLHVEQSVTHGTLIPRIDLEFAGVATVCGRRPTNEDRYVLAPIHKGLIMLALFDGHGGASGAEFARLMLPDFVRYWTVQKGETNLSRIMRRCFVELNNLMARQVFRLCPSESNSGCTATVALLRNSVDLLVAHVGDSRAVLCRGGRAAILSKDHDPGLEEEQKRIESRGGLVSTNSLGVPVVNGRLGMTRSLGDAQLKPYGVTAEPYLRQVKISHGRDAFLVLVTDGVTFVMSNEELVDLVSSCKNPQEAANIVTDQALQFGSEDNATAIVLPFGSWGKYARHGGDRPNKYSFSRSMFSARSYG